MCDIAECGVSWGCGTAKQSEHRDSRQQTAARRLHGIAAQKQHQHSGEQEGQTLPPSPHTDTDTDTDTQTRSSTAPIWKSRQLRHEVARLPNRGSAVVGAADLSRCKSASAASCLQMAMFALGATAHAAIERSAAKGREGKGREGKGREGKGREGIIKDITEDSSH